MVIRLITAVLVGAAALMAADTSLNLIPKRGRGVAPANARGDGPWVTRIMLATSTNGLGFARRQFVLSDQAGVPNAIVDREGRARIYYVDFGNGNVMACATQSRIGLLTNWNYRRVTISGLPKEYRNGPVDPSVVTLTNGYRLYFMQAAPTPAIYSAFSTNGFDFVKEAGVRISKGTEPLLDPTILRTKDQWLLWCGPGGRVVAQSADGLNFSNAIEFRVERARFMPWSAVALPNNGGYRLYGNFLGAGEWSGGVSSVFSRDGKIWNREMGIRLSLGGSRYPLESRIFPDNGCVLLPNGTWLMAYLATIPEPRRR